MKRIVCQAEENPLLWNTGNLGDPLGRSKIWQCRQISVLKIPKSLVAESTWYVPKPDDNVNFLMAYGLLTHVTRCDKDT